MANEVALVAAEIGLVDPIKAVVKDYIAGAAITKGQVVSLSTDKYVDPADASADNALAQNVVGIALNAAGVAGDAVAVAEDAELEGFTVSGLTAGDTLFLSSDTAGALSTVTGTVGVYLGKVVPKNDGTLVVRFQATWGRAPWS